MPPQAPPIQRTLSVNTTPNFQTWYLVSMEPNLRRRESRETSCWNIRRLTFGDLQPGRAPSISLTTTPATPPWWRPPRWGWNPGRSCPAPAAPLSARRRTGLRTFWSPAQWRQVRDGWRTPPPLRLTFCKDHQTAGKKKEKRSKCLTLRLTNLSQ